jgi:membrane protein DedA with SNARE-associated domain
MAIETSRPSPPSRRTLVLLVAPLVALWIMGLVVGALTPALLAKHPLALVILEPRNRNLILTASLVDPVPFVVFAILRRFLSDPLYFLLGYYYGESAVRWAERRMGDGGSFVRAVEHVFKKARGVMVFLFPGILVCVLAGATRMRVRTFIILNAVGTVTVVICLRLFAKTIEGPVGAVQNFNARNFRWLTAVSIVLVIVWFLSQRAQGKDELARVNELEREMAKEEE